MAKLTDYVRKGYRRRQRPWEATELPEWWGLATWIGAACVVVMLVVSALLARGETATGAEAGDAEAPRYPVETLNPGMLTASPGSGSPGASSSAGARPSQSPPVELTAESFKATNAVRVAKSGGGSAIVPAGARNVALAAARATAIGDWSGIPFIGARPTPTRGPTPQGSVVGELTVADPTVTGNSQYRFTAKITHGGGEKPYDLTIPVEWNGDGYAIRGR